SGARGRLRGRKGGNPDYQHPKLLDPARRPYRAGGRLRRQRQGARTPSLSPPQLAVARNFAVRSRAPRRFEQAFRIASITKTVVATARGPVVRPIAFCPARNSFCVARLLDLD